MIPAPEFEPFDRSSVLFGRDIWESLFEEALKAHPPTAHSLGLLLIDLIGGISGGQEAKERAINTLKLGIEWLYTLTPASGAALVAFLHYLDGTLPDAASLDRLLTGAVIESERHRRTRARRQPKTAMHSSESPGSSAKPSGNLSSGRGSR